MARSLPSFGVPVLFLSLLVVSGCNSQADFSVTGPAPLTATASIHSSFGAEPSSVEPEFFHAGSCVGIQAFGARVGVRVHGGHDVILRGLRFSYVDRFGIRALPDVLPIPTLSTPVALTSHMPSSSAVSVPGFAPLPSATLIPIPGSSPIHGVIIPAGTSRMFTFYVKFECGVFNSGVIVIVVDAGDRDGRFSTSELRVKVGA